MIRSLSSPGSLHPALSSATRDRKAGPRECSKVQDSRAWRVRPRKPPPLPYAGWRRIPRRSDPTPVFRSGGTRRDCSGHRAARESALPHPVCLSWLVTFHPDSGQHRDGRRPRGGRARSRHFLYMAGLSAGRPEHTSQARFERLVAGGKPQRVVTVAVMRRLACLSSTLLREPAAAGRAAWPRNGSGLMSAPTFCPDHTCPWGVKRKEFKYPNDHVRSIGVVTVEPLFCAKLTAPSAGPKPRYATNTRFHGLGSFANGGGPCSRSNESVATRARDPRRGIRKSGAVSPARAGTCPNCEVKIRGLRRSLIYLWVH